MTALLLHLMDGFTAGGGGSVSRGAAARAAAWCRYLEAHARRLYAIVTDPARVAAALLARRVARGRLASPFTAREVYRNDWAGLTEPRVVREALACLNRARLASARGGQPQGRRPTHRAVPRQSAGRGKAAITFSAGGGSTVLSVLAVTVQPGCPRTGPLRDGPVREPVYAEESRPPRAHLTFSPGAGFRLGV